MNRSIFRTSLVTLAAVLSIAPVLAKDETAKSSATAASTVATVNGKTIQKNRADALVASQTAQGQPDSAELRKAVREELIRREVIAQEAQKKGVDKKGEIQGQMELARQSVVIGAYLGDYVRSHPVGEEAVKKEYDAIKLKLGDKEYKVRHILVEKEDEARTSSPS